MLSKDDEEKILPKSGNDQNSDFYLENPQIAKTEELLKFLPIVIEKLSAYQPEHFVETRKERSSDKLNKTKKKNTRSLPKNKLEKSKLKEAQKEIKVSEDEFTNTENEIKMADECSKNVKNDVSLNQNDSQKPNVPSKILLDILKIDLKQCNKSIDFKAGHNFKNDEDDKEAVAIKSCLSVKSNENFNQEFPDDLFNRINIEGPPTKPNELANENYNSCNVAFVSFSDYDYSAECRNLEKELLSECDHVLEDIRKEADSMQIY